MKRARNQADIVRCGPKVYQDCTIRLEEWVREFISVVRLRKRSRSESDKTVACKSMGRDMKVSEITGIRPEASRSNPGQGEVWRKLDGGPIPVLETNRSGDLGLGVKSQSRLAIAGSFRNVS